MPISLIITSCLNNAKQEKPLAENYQVDTIQNKQVASPASLIKNDTLFIKESAAVFIEPDSLQIEKQKKSIGEENFYIGADDYLYYMNIAIEFTDSIKLTSVRNNGKKFIKFIKSDQSNEVIKIDTLPELWNIYFFSPTKNPKSVDMTMIEEEYNTYFK